MHFQIPEAASDVAVDAVQCDQRSDGGGIPRALDEQLPQKLLPGRHVHWVGVCLCLAHQRSHLDTADNRRLTVRLDVQLIAPRTNNVGSDPLVPLLLQCRQDQGLKPERPCHLT